MNILSCFSTFIRCWLVQVDEKLIKCFEEIRMRLCFADYRVSQYSGALGTKDQHFVFF